MSCRRLATVAWLACLAVALGSPLGEKGSHGSPPEAAQRGTGFTWGKSNFTGSGDIHPKQVDRDPVSGGYVVSGSWTGNATFGDHTVEATTCNSQECSIFVMKLSPSDDGGGNEVEWVIPAIEAQKDETVIQLNSMGVGPGSSVFLDGQYCFENIYVGDGEDRQLLTISTEQDCMAFLARVDSSGAAIWASKFAGSNTHMEVGGIQAHPVTGDVFITGLFMGTNVTFQNFTVSSSLNRKDDPADLGREWYHDTDTEWLHHYSVWIAKVDGATGDIVWLQTLNTTNTMMSPPNIALDVESERLYITLSTYDPPFLVYSTPDQESGMLSDGFVMQLATDGGAWHQPLMIDAADLTDFNPIVEDSDLELDEVDDGDTLREESYLKYLTSVTASNGHIYLAGTFYGSLVLHGHEIHSQSANHEASFIAKVRQEDMQVQWLKKMSARGNLDIRHIEYNGLAAYAVGWMYGEADFGNVMLGSTAPSLRSEAFVAELDTATGDVLWAEKGPAEEFYDAIVEPPQEGLELPRLTILGGFQWFSEADYYDQIVGPWGETTPVQGHSGLVLLQTVLNPSDDSYMEARNSTKHLDTTESLDTTLSLPAKEAQARPVDHFSPSLPAPPPLDTDVAEAPSPQSSAALSVLSKVMIGIAITMCALALCGILFLLVLCFKKRKNVDAMYTSYRPSEASIPELRATDGFPTHSRNPSDGTGTLALARMTHLPAISFCDQNDDDPFQASVNVTPRHLVVDVQQDLKLDDESGVVTVKAL